MISAKLTEEDFIKQLFVASTHEYIMFISSAGKAYWIKVHEVTEGSRTAKGPHIKTLLKITADEEITAIVSFNEFAEDRYIFMGTERGVVKKVQLSEFSKAKTRGVIAVTLDEGDRLVSALLTTGNDELMLISKQGQALRTAEDQVRSMGRSSRGIKGMRIGDDDALVAVLGVSEKESMLLVSKHGYGKRVDFSEFTPHGRGTGGQKIYTISDKTGELIGSVSVLENEEIMCVTTQGKSIKVKVSDIRIMGRAAQGVRVLNIDDSDAVVGVDKIVSEEA